MWNKIMKEVSLKRYAGPFTEIPFKNYVQSPIGLVPKAENQTRLIFHLSYDFPSGNKSVNHYTPQHKCTVKYRDLDHAVINALRLLRMYKEATNKEGCLWYSKTDIKSAFRILCLAVKTFWLLVMYAIHPESGRKFYFIDKCLPFGHSISCALFQRFSNAVAHIFKFAVRIKVENQALWMDLTNYLDDFLFMALTKLFCDWLTAKFLWLCQDIGVPIAMEKTEWGMMVIVFLGVLLDGRTHRLGLPEEKRIRAVNELTELIDKKKVTGKQLQMLM